MEDEEDDEALFAAVLGDGEGSDDEDEPEQLDSEDEGDDDVPDEPDEALLLQEEKEEDDPGLDIIDDNGSVDTLVHSQAQDTFQALVANISLRETIPRSLLQPHDRMVQVFVFLLRSRGYVLEECPESSAALLPKKCNVLVGRRPGGVCGLFYPTQAKIGIQGTREICAFVETLTGPFKEVVVVTAEGVTPGAKKHLFGENMPVQLFRTKELRQLYVQHKILPSQQALTDTEKAKVLKKYRCTEKQLPVMSHVDAIAKFYGWVPGTVVRCVRKIGDADEPLVYYRLVSEIDHC